MPKVIYAYVSGFVFQVLPDSPAGVGLGSRVLFTHAIRQPYVYHVSRIQ